MASDNKDGSSSTSDVVVLHRQNWEQIKGGLENFRAHLEDAEALSNRARRKRVELEDRGRSLVEVDRLACIMALEGALALAMNLFPGQGWPLGRIYDVLYGIHFGLEPDPLLQISREKKRPPQGGAVQRLKGAAAAALELYRRSGQNLKPASEKIARQVNLRDLESIGYKASPYQSIKGRTVMDWRSEIRQAGPRSVAAGHYNKLLNDFREYRDDEAAEAADFILSNLMIPKKSG